MIVAMQRKLAIMAVALAAAPVVAQDEEVRQVFIDDVAQVRIETSLGNIVVELNAERAPMTVESFLQYVVDDYYDGTIFHRVAAGFIVHFLWRITGALDRRDKELLEKLGRNDPCPCGSGRRF